MGEILGVGIEEILFIGILIAMLFGPESIPRIARSAGRMLNKLMRSSVYREGQEIRRQIKDLPGALARLAELEEIQDSINKEIGDLKQVFKTETHIDFEGTDTAATPKPASPDSRAADKPPPSSDQSANDNQNGDVEKDID